MSREQVHENFLIYYRKILHAFSSNFFRERLNSSRVIPLKFVGLLVFSSFVWVLSFDINRAIIILRRLSRWTSVFYWGRLLVRFLVSHRRNGGLVVFFRRIFINCFLGPVVFRGGAWRPCWEVRPSSFRISEFLYLFVYDFSIFIVLILDCLLLFLFKHHEGISKILNSFDFILNVLSLIIVLIL